MTGPLTSAGGILLSSFLSNYNIQDSLPDHSVYFMDSTQAHASRIGLKREVSIPQHLISKLLLHMKTNIHLKATGTFEQALKRNLLNFSF